MKYIGYYSLPEVQPQRVVPLAGRNKMTYTANLLAEICGHVDIYSPAITAHGAESSPRGNLEVNDHITLHLFRTIRNNTHFKARVNNVLALFQLFVTLLFKTKKDEPILVYHSLAYSKLILFAKRIRRFKLILELNEMYSDVTTNLAKKKKIELKIISNADAFMFPNDLMNTMFNHKHKPFVVEYGIYTPECKYSEKFNDGKIHVVYAGTFNPAKGGAAAAAANYLPSNYHVHILGFGSKNQIEELERIAEYVNKKDGCKITYDGKLDGIEFIKYLQKFHIGLSTQNPDAAFNATSFPSKILTYLANGLQVVSIDIPAISESELKDDIIFYSNQTPHEIAKAILRVDDFTPHFKILQKLDIELKSNLKHILDVV